jgi:outer membrane lipoprotein-sorting protein
MRHRFLSSFLTLTICATMASSASAQAPTTAAGIMKNVLSRDAFGWDSAETRVRMILTAKNGKQAQRVMTSVRRRKNGLLASVVCFRSPQKVAGTAFLMQERKKGETQQYIYLPNLRRTRRLVGREREGSFMGSDFSYADMERRDTRESSHKRLPDEKIGTVPVFVIESTPNKGSGSTYSKIQTWVRKDNFLPLRIRFFDPKGKPVKAFYARKIRNMKNGRAVIVESKMQNKQTGHSTDLILDDLQPRENIPDSTFTPTALEHGC